MRPSVGLVMLVLLGACNQILGNSSDNHLIGDGSSAGSQGTGATSSSGGKSAGSSGKTSSSGSLNDAGADMTSGGDDSGAAGEGSTGPCTASGPEDCLNGKDDDCNGDIDCADAACAGPAQCVTAPSGAALGYFPVTGNTCAAGYEPVTLHQGLSAAPQCTGCTCTPETADCDASFGASYPGTCPDFQIQGQTYDVFSSHCEAVAPNSTQVHFYSVRGLATCTPGGTGVVSPPAWETTRTFCELKVGKGCASGEVCAPQNSTDMATCTRLSGSQSCTAGLGTSMGEPWSASYTDERQCHCQCGFGDSTCGQARIRVYSGANCTGTSADLDSGAEGDNCALAFTPVSGQIVGGGPGTDQCPVDAPITGELLPATPRTICCH